MRELVLRTFGEEMQALKFIRVHSPSSKSFPTQMASLEGARPKCKSKKVFDPDFVYDCPSNRLFQDDTGLTQDELNNSAPFQFSKQPEPKPKIKVPSSMPLSDVPPASSLSFDQQLQLVNP